MCAIADCLVENSFDCKSCRWAILPHLGLCNIYSADGTHLPGRAVISSRKAPSSVRQGVSATRIAHLVHWYLVDDRYNASECAIVGSRVLPQYESETRTQARTTAREPQQVKQHSPKSTKNLIAPSAFLSESLEDFYISTSSLRFCTELFSFMANSIQGMLPIGSLSTLRVHSFLPD